MFSRSTIKYIQSLQHKKFRDEHNVFVAEGPKLVNELLAAKIFPCVAIHAVEEWVSALPIPLKKNIENRITVIKDAELARISGLSQPNQVLAVFQKKAQVVPLGIKNKITLVLDDLQDPGNLGTIIRIADWFGIRNMICSQHTADIYNPKVVQSTMASLGRVNVFYTDITAWCLKDQSVKKYAASLAGKELSSFGKLKEGIIIIGNESKGISAGVLKLADEKITIPRIGEAESLNAAVAAGIILYGIT